MPEIKIALSLQSLRLPLKKALQTAASLGVTGVEIDARHMLKPSELTDTGRRQLKKMMSDLNLEVAAVRFPTRRGYDILQDLDRRIEATKEAMRFAYSLGTNSVINAVGRVPEWNESADSSEGEECPAPPAGLDQLLSSLGDLAHFGQHVGAMLACETGTEPVATLAGLLDRLTEKTIGIAFNPANLIVNGYYDEDAIGIVSDRTLTVAARDASRDLARGRGIEVSVGQGSAEFPNILATLEQRQYRGWFILERSSQPDALRELRDAVSFLRSL